MGLCVNIWNIPRKRQCQWKHDDRPWGPCNQTPLFHHGFSEWLIQCLVPTTVTTVPCSVLTNTNTNTNTKPHTHTHVEMEMVNPPFTEHVLFKSGFLLTEDRRGLLKPCCPLYAGLVPSTDLCDLPRGFKLNLYLSHWPHPDTLLEFSYMHIQPIFFACLNLGQLGQKHYLYITFLWVSTGFPHPCKRLP